MGFAFGAVLGGLSGYGSPEAFPAPDFLGGSRRMATAIFDALVVGGGFGLLGYLAARESWTPAGGAGAQVSIRPGAHSMGIGVSLAF